MVKNKTEKNLIQGKHGADFIIKSSFVPDTQTSKANPHYKEPIYVDKSKNIATGRMRADGVMFYERVTNEYNGETLYHREIYLTAEDIKTLSTAIDEIEEYRGEGIVPEDLPF